MVNKRYVLDVLMAVLLSTAGLIALGWLLNATPSAAQTAPALGYIGGPAEQPMLQVTDVITVCLGGGCDYDNIQDAVTNAPSAARIKIATGIYTDADTALTVPLAHITKALALVGGYTTAFSEPPDPDANPTVLEAVEQNDPPSLLRAEREAFRIEHNQLAAEMMDDWGLPGSFSAAARAQDSCGAAGLPPRSLADRLAWTLEVSTAIARWVVSPTDIETFAADVCHRGIEPTEFPELIRSIALEWQGVAPLFSFSVAAAPTHEPESHGQVQSRVDAGRAAREQVLGQPRAPAERERVAPWCARGREDQEHHEEIRSERFRHVARRRDRPEYGSEEEEQGPMAQPHLTSPPRGGFPS